MVRSELVVKLSLDTLTKAYYYINATPQESARKIYSLNVPSRRRARCGEKLILIVLFFLFF